MSTFSIGIVMAAATAAAAAATAAAERSGSPSECRTPVDCQLNGLCTNGVCVCDPMWKGANCSVMNLMPAKMENGYGSLNSTVSSWGAGVLFDPESGKWVMMVDEMNNNCGLGTWGHNSRAVLAEADAPDGPYTKTQVLIHSWSHGATPARDPKSGTWLFNHMGTGATHGGQCTMCSDGVTPEGAKPGLCGPGGIATASAVVGSSAKGPFRPAPGIRNGANCEGFFHPNGTLFMACPSSGKTTAPNCNGQNAFLHMSRADSIEAAMAGNFTGMPVLVALAGTADPFLSPPAICFNWEDQNLWIDARGNFHTLMHAYRGQPCDYPVCDRVMNKQFCTAVGGHAFSEDGYNWWISPVVAYTPTTEFVDGTSITWRARERPHLIFDAARTGVPTHLINGVGNPGCGGNTGCPGHDHTFTLVTPLGTA